jgi:hypothetical protein
MRKSLLKIIGIALISLLAVGCAHKGTVSSIRATNIYSDSEKKLPGNVTYVVDQTSLTKLQVKDTVQGFQCGAHTFPVDGMDAFRNSFPQMLDQVFENIRQSDSPPKDGVGLIFRVERFEPSIRFSPKFFGADGTATVDMGVSVTGNKNGVRVFGTTVDTQRSKNGDAGFYCSDGGQIVADAVRDAAKDILEKLGERMANSASLKAALAPPPPPPPAGVKK